MGFDGSVDFVDFGGREGVVMGLEGEGDGEGFGIGRYLWAAVEVEEGDGGEEGADEVDFGFEAIVWDGFGDNDGDIAGGGGEFGERDVLVVSCHG